MRILDLLGSHCGQQFEELHVLYYGVLINFFFFFVLTPKRDMLSIQDSSRQQKAS